MFAGGMLGSRAHQVTLGQAEATGPSTQPASEANAGGLHGHKSDVEKHVAFALTLRHRQTQRATASAIVTCAAVQSCPRPVILGFARSGVQFAGCRLFDGLGRAGKAWQHRTQLCKRCRGPSSIAAQTLS